MTWWRTGGGEGRGLGNRTGDQESSSVGFLGEIPRSRWSRPGRGPQQRSSLGTDTLYIRRLVNNNWPPSPCFS